MSCGFGGLAEYAVTPKNFLVYKPANVSFENAVAFPMAALSVLQALCEKGNIKAGQEVLIIGTGEGVGTFDVQLAKYFWAAATAVCIAGNMPLSKSLGADKAID